jgi:hypothetical protein
VINRIPAGLATNRAPTTRRVNLSPDARGGGQEWKPGPGQAIFDLMDSRALVALSERARDLPQEGRRQLIRTLAARATAGDAASAAGLVRPDTLWLLDDREQAALADQVAWSKVRWQLSHLLAPILVATHARLGMAGLAQLMALEESFDGPLPALVAAVEAAHHPAIDDVRDVPVAPDEPPAA